MEAANRCAALRDDLTEDDKEMIFNPLQPILQIHVSAIRFCALHSKCMYVFIVVVLFYCCRVNSGETVTSLRCLRKTELSAVCTGEFHALYLLSYVGYINGSMILNEQSYWTPAEEIALEQAFEYVLSAHCKYTCPQIILSTLSLFTCLVSYTSLLVSSRALSLCKPSLPHQ